MTDYLSRSRLYSQGYTPPDFRYAVPNYRELYHETAPLLFKRRPRAHDCRMEFFKDHWDRRDWETWLLSRGLSDTYTSVRGLHCKAEESRESKKKKPDKLLFNIGLRGSIDGDFNYPRGLAVSMDGDILVADSMNHRIQVFNGTGVFKIKFGTKGKENGQFDQPTSLCHLPNGDIAVADKNNCRIQVFTEKGEFKYTFPTVDRPFSIACDKNFTIGVSTTARTIEIYRRAGKLLHRFPLGRKSKTTDGCQICMNNKDEVVVCDPSIAAIIFYNYDGKRLYRFKPESNFDGLDTMPSAICLTPLDQLLVSDVLNHVVNLYTERGVLLQQIVCPTDDAGPTQTIALGVEGHMITTEFSVIGEHCLKIFRYRDCHCHFNRPGSSKRRTPTTPS